MSAREPSDLLHNIGGPPIKNIVWRGYREEIQRAGLDHSLASMDEAHSLWVEVRGQAVSHLQETLDVPEYQSWVRTRLESLRDSLLEHALIPATLLSARWTPSVQTHSISSLWLAWLLIAQSTPSFWSARRGIVIERIRDFYPPDPAASALSQGKATWTCAIRIEDRRLPDLTEYLNQWEQTHDAERPNF